jgi:hypothetical protein
VRWVEVPLHTESEANWTGPLRAKLHRKRDQRAHTLLVLRSTLGAPPAPPLVVQLTRLESTQHADDDNAVAALKHVRDGVADWLGVDDGVAGGVLWAYAQEATPGRFGVRIEVVPGGRACPTCSGRRWVPPALDARSIAGT